MNFMNLEFYGSNESGILYKGRHNFMILGLKENISMYRKISS